MEHRSRLSEYRQMRLVTEAEYSGFLESNDSVSIVGTRIRLPRTPMVDKYVPEDFVPEEWTVWSFPSRGDWATHKGDYRGNWSPFIPRNLIQKYTIPGDLVCDPMVGSGTTLIECKLMARRAVGVDVNLNSVMVAMNRLHFELREVRGEATGEQIRSYHGDARNLNQIEDQSVDLVATHPPYSDTISYAGSPDDLSQLGLEEFVQEMGIVASECFRVLKPNKHCGILIGDTRRHQHYVPIHVGVLGRFLDAGFILKEDIIKIQHNTLGTRERWTGRSYDFYKIAHEHLYIFRKPQKAENESRLRYSKKWW